ncbi:hypothetical protein EV178_004648 [Coemansia sp. RSA 1646]|nr:hypothetical protein EV178_004648 [Coemansia sp. RSA 1646]KAJ2087738.1 hypothetical protein IW138_004766 [Coemansia sp. RSA 986]
MHAEGTGGSSESVPTSLVVLLVVCVVVGLAAILWCFFTTCVGKDVLLYLRYRSRQRSQQSTQLHGRHSESLLPRYAQDPDDAGDDDARSHFAQSS